MWFVWLLLVLVIGVGLIVGGCYLDTPNYYSSNILACFGFFIIYLEPLIFSGFNILHVTLNKMIQL